LSKSKKSSVSLPVEDAAVNIQNQSIDKSGETAISGATNESTRSDVQEIVELWKQFNIEEKRVQLDKNCVEMREMKNLSIAGRKRLNDITKAFRGSTNAVSITDLLKAYQEEIDQLSRRSKYSETAFINLFKSFHDLPDPVPVIESLIDNVLNGSANSLEIDRLKNELRQYDEEFQQLKNQDITIRRLEDQLADLRENQSAKVSEEVASRVGDIEQRCNLRVVSAEAQCREERRLADRRVLAAQEALQRALDSADRAQSQLFESNSRAEERSSALMAENSLLAEGIHRLQVRVTELQQQLSQLTHSPSADDSDPSSDPSSSAPGQQTSKSQTLTLQLVVGELREELQRQSDSSRNELLARQRAEAALREASQQLSRERDAATQLRQELASRPSKEEFLDFKRQLRVLHRIAFNVQDDQMDEAQQAFGDSDDDEEAEEDKAKRRANEDSTPRVTKSAMRAKYNLEVLLVTRLKSLETELAGARRDLNEAREQEAAAKDSARALKKSLESSTSLIARLEADLEASGLSASNRGGSGASQRRSREPRNSSNTNGSEDGGSSMELAELLGVDTRPSSVNVNISITNPNPNERGGTHANANSQQMVLILQSQRDRYKERLTVAESTVLKLQQVVDASAAMKASLESDNLALYSKIRFLQSYQGSSSKGYRSGKSSSSQEEGRSSEEWQEDGGEVEKKYHSLYEQRMNPFAEFSEHEKRRKLTELSVADRIILNTTMAVVSHQAGRSLLLVYFGAMHLLVFVTLYYSVHRVHYGCDPNLDHLLK